MAAAPYRAYGAVYARSVTLQTGQAQRRPAAGSRFSCRGRSTTRRGDEKRQMEMVLCRLADNKINLRPGKDARARRGQTTPRFPLLSNSARRQRRGAKGGDTPWALVTRFASVSPSRLRLTVTPSAGVPVEISRIWVLRVLIRQSLLPVLTS